MTTVLVPYRFLCEQTLWEINHFRVSSSISIYFVIVQCSGGDDLFTTLCK